MTINVDCFLVMNELLKGWCWRLVLVYLKVCRNLVGIY